MANIKIKNKQGQEAVFNNVPKLIVNKVGGGTQEFVIGGGGGGSASGAGVQFIDYDGTLVDFWSASDVASKTALPANPTGHTRLVAEGWNWTLAKIKAYIESYPDAVMTVGQMYHTASGKSEFDVTLTKVTGKTVTFKMVGNKDWGDGTSDALLEHTYADYGDYTVKCDGTSIPAGSYSSGGLFGSTSANVNGYWCTRAFIGELATSIDDYAFCLCRSLKSITIPNSVTSMGEGAFDYGYHLTSVTIPDGVTSISDYTFENCYVLTSVAISDGVTSIGNYAFSYCKSLKSVSIPDGVTTIGMMEFGDCISLTSVTIPDSVTSIESGAFGECYSLTSITVPSSVTSITGTAFKACHSLTRVTISGTVPLLDNYVFQSCFSVMLYDFSHFTSVPTNGAVPFDGINGLCKIVVPDDLYDEWFSSWQYGYRNYLYKASEVT